VNGTNIIVLGTFISPNQTKKLNFVLTVVILYVLAFFYRMALFSNNSGKLWICFVNFGLGWENILCLTLPANLSKSTKFDSKISLKIYTTSLLKSFYNCDTLFYVCMSI